jgi:predicted XRE-type DNA-binding protein
MKKKTASSYPAEIENASANIKARYELVQRIDALIQANGWTQMEAAERANAFQPRISHLLRGHIEKFSLDALINIATRLGLSVELVITNSKRRKAA